MTTKLERTPAELFLRSHVRREDVVKIWQRVVQAPRSARLKTPRTREGAILAILDEEINYPDRFRNLIAEEAGRVVRSAEAIWWKLGCASGFHVFDRSWEVDDSCAAHFPGMTDDPRATPRVRHARALLHVIQCGGLRKGDRVLLTWRHRQPGLEGRPRDEAYLEWAEAHVTSADPVEWAESERPLFGFLCIGPRWTQPEGSPFVCYEESGCYHSGVSGLPQGKPFGIQRVQLTGRYTPPKPMVVTPDMKGFKVG